MKELKLKTLWTLDLEFRGEMVQVYSNKLKSECIKVAKTSTSKTTIQKRKVITDKY
jgi:hypothetical protein